ncbi:MAG: hypothetical protein CLLPBCKN_003361 [Chroococcidiopsis cubana SAG 39.79]|uniref:Uncharacterized protein n=1 Tax=Chroococcidiopsis cubana SAG 39.79 TaxID=388085 RepID=A0AB37U9H4_9CYAN|nr:hypothetical protein [Chroococcidiopsis cubana]MDZ4873965.1 hypothetical protein [Chroococcidiopsis cubana SAG 39.79]PSB59673.1 hypothetical protein C7B79_28585 [Chroococcidiopsis cubana CCALA 043]RUT00475.1 hypothetical protein DSM107010_67830 [Chroococcidiopsis cubana SAG 39.79]
MTKRRRWCDERLIDEVFNLIDKFQLPRDVMPSATLIQKHNKSLYNAIHIYYGGCIQAARLLDLKPRANASKFIPSLK